MNEQQQSTTDTTKVTPLRCLLGASISGGLGAALYFLTSAISQTYANQPIHSVNPIIVNISIAVRTLVVGIVALGTFVFSFVALGLILLAIQLVFQSLKKRFTSSSDN